MAKRLHPTTSPVPAACTIHHLFCRDGGGRPFARGHLAVPGGDFCTVSLACRDDVPPPQELVDAPLHFGDGHANNRQSSPAETRHL